MALSTLVWRPFQNMEQYSSSWPHQGHRLWASMPVAFWVYFYKVQRCPLSGAHDWKECPYSHPWERARRRDPRMHPYLPEPCPDYLASHRYHKTHRTGKAPTCVRGRTCRYAHGIFEVWLHQDRFRTRMCFAGQGCDRKICFFAHFFSQQRRPGERVPFVDLELTLRSPPQSNRTVPPPVVAPATAPHPQRDLGGMMLRTRSGMRRISSLSLSSSFTSSSGALSSSPPPLDVVVAVTATTPPALGCTANDSKASAYPMDNEKDNAMSGDEDSELAEFPHFDVIRDFVLG